MERAEHHAPPLVVLRSETETGHVALRLVGELDLHTVAVLEAALARPHGDPPPSVIDVSELRFLDLVGLRALLNAVEDDVTGLARLVGATGIVRRLIELARSIDAPREPPPGTGVQAPPSTIIAAEWVDAPTPAHRPPVIYASPPVTEERA